MLISKVRSDVHWQTIKLTSFQYSTIVPTVQSWSEHSAVKAQTALIIKITAAKEQLNQRRSLQMKLILYFHSYMQICFAMHYSTIATTMTNDNKQGQTNNYYAQIEHLSIMLLSITCIKNHSIMLKIMLVPQHYAQRCWVNFVQRKDNS